MQWWLPWHTKLSPIVTDSDPHTEVCNPPSPGPQTSAVLNKYLQAYSVMGKKDLNPFVVVAKKKKKKKKKKKHRKKVACLNIRTLVPFTPLPLLVVKPTIAMT
eukprot:1342033-Amorphochlora_amoeboformis.AAC.1